MSGPHVNVALFGAGRIGCIHAQNISLHRDSQVSLIIDPNVAAATRLADAVGGSVASIDDARNDSTINAWCICSATPTHAALITEGLTNGKAVFCEKPIDLDLKTVERTLHRTADCDAPLMVGFNRRFDPAVMEMRRRINEGRIGALELVTIISKDPEAPPLSYVKESGGLFRDMTIHDFDMARFILGEEPTHVTAVASALTGPAIQQAGDIDTAVVTLQCDSGRIAVITNSRRASFGYDQRIEAHGALGTLRTENVSSTTLIQERQDGVMLDNPLHFFTERYEQSYTNEWAHFIDALKSKTPPSPAGIDGLRALQLAEAAYESLHTGQRIVVAPSLS